MEKQAKSTPRSKQPGSNKFFSFFLSFIETLKNPPIPYDRLTMVIGTLLLGAFLIETHPTFDHSLVGILLWAVCVYLIRVWFSPVPGFRAFSGSDLQGVDVQEEWDWKRNAPLGLCLLAILGASHYFIHQGQWIPLLIALGIFGGLLSVLEKHSVLFSAEPPEKTPGTAFQKLWPWLLIALVGAFFLLYGWDVYAIGHNIDAYVSVDLANNYLKNPDQGGVWTTPYMDGWSLGNPAFAFYLMGSFFKLVGSSLVKGTLCMGLVVFGSYFFLFGFLRFYLPKYSALLATLLFSSCYWVVYFGHVTTGGNGLTPLLECASLFFFARALEYGQTKDYLLFGALIPCYLMTSVQGRVFLVFAILSLAILCYFHRSELLGQKKSWALAWGVAFLWYLPMILYYQHTANPLVLGNEVFARDAAWGGGKFSIPWANILTDLQSFNVQTTDGLTEYLPRLSPWEGLAFLAGLGWTLRRFFKPPFFILLMGFGGNLAPAFMTNAPTLPWRMLSVAPFVYLLVGIGLDRLGRIVASPLGSKGGWLRLVLMFLFGIFSIGWHYDAFFHRLPLAKYAYWSDGSNQSGEHYTLGKVSAKYIRGWDTYVDVQWGLYFPYAPEGGLSYPMSEVMASVANRVLFKPDPFPLPLKKAGEKGAALLLHDEDGRALQDWIQYYYPEAHPQEILNPFGDVEMRVWEITPAQIQQALSQPARTPPGGMTLSWFDTQNHLLGKMTVPTLAAKALNQEWLNGNPAPVPWDKASYFTAQGVLEDAAGKLLAVETGGKAEGLVGGQRFHVEGAGHFKRTEVQCPAKTGNGVPFKIRFTLQSPGNFDLNFLEQDVTGWDMIPSSELKPQ